MFCIVSETSQEQKQDSKEMEKHFVFNWIKAMNRTVISSNIKHAPGQT